MHEIKGKLADLPLTVHWAREYEEERQKWEDTDWWREAAWDIDGPEEKAFKVI